MALPFMPGAGVGIAVLTGFAHAIAALPHMETMAAMMLSFAPGRVLPDTTLAALMRLLHLRPAAKLVERARRQASKDRLALLLDGAPPRTPGIALRHRDVALAEIGKLPGIAGMGGGGGIMTMAGLSRVLAPGQTFLAAAIAVSPVPVAVMRPGAGPLRR